MSVIQKIGRVIRRVFSFKEALRYVTAKQTTTTRERTASIAANWSEEATRKAFFSARVAEADILNKIHNLVNDVVRGEMTQDQARELLRKFLSEDGSKKLLQGMGFSPDYDMEGSVSNLASTRRLKLILYQNSKMAHEVGAYQKWRENWDILPYGRWHIGGSKEHREAHKARDGMIFHHNHPVWTKDPPGGLFNCRCWREDLTEEEVVGSRIEPFDYKFDPSPLKFDPSKGLDQLPDIKPLTVDEIRQALQNSLKNIP